MYGHLKEILQPQVQSLIKGEQIKQVIQFEYPGYLIPSDGRCTSEISERIATAKDTFQEMKPILANRNISMDTKIRVIKACVCLLCRSVGGTVTSDSTLRSAGTLLSRVRASPSATGLTEDLKA
ncbi:endonuclease-reverse transcriptase [Plakobranchus ocellatus]|uniref:Endonuclease-reverse transcriptase n=1 Tax=Plakobranchus ocellatus TaxID=259542 RepID=A0AAV3YCA9_9GAST|nr:endonuclease-reverse transcriptase [Plakobranchus ocellatus]